MNTIREIDSIYSLIKIYNANESGSFYRMSQKKTYIGMKIGEIFVEKMSRSTKSA